ncbi:response regulator [Altererythrobacter sp. B11]|uniref:response regulator n=1 Tax=Altererythrobacter sp. B11 TaxID=2060312 RepID=UPI000DC707BC|nr:response regulator [Altererythrobacter sp. B11]BBC72226.1 response regulator [Altererythrobacter sp. B11]
MATAAVLSDQRPTVLVVEDEFIIALDLSETVKDLGYELEGPFADKKNAFLALGKGMPDCAILDVYTSDGEVFPLADALAQAGVPIIFHSGHVSPEEMRQRYPSAIACTKPCPPDHMIDMLQLALEQGRSHH